MGRLRHAPRAPLAVAGILATPIFFVALMAFSLLLDKPSAHIAANGTETLGDPVRATVAAIYALAFLASILVVLAGVLGMVLPARVGVYVPCLAAIVVTVLLLLPLDSWETKHTERYPDGVDLIPRADPSDLMLRGEWEANAKRAAEQIGVATLVIAAVAIATALLLDVRRRRGGVRPPVPPPPPEISHPS